MATKKLAVEFIRGDKHFYNLTSKLNVEVSLTLKTSSLFLVLNSPLKFDSTGTTNHSNVQVEVSESACHEWGEIGGVAGYYEERYASPEEEDALGGETPRHLSRQSVKKEDAEHRLKRRRHPVPIRQQRQTER